MHNMYFSSLLVYLGREPLYVNVRRLCKLINLGGNPPKLTLTGTDGDEKQVIYSTWPKYTRREVKIHISAWTSLIIHIAQKSRGILHIAQFSVPKTFIRTRRMAPTQQQFPGCCLDAFSTTTSRITLH